MPVESSLNGEESRRSVYIQMRRSRPLAMLNSFDAPVMEVNCEKRQSSTVATQSLMLMNSDFTLDQAARFASRLKKEAGDDVQKQIALAWQVAYGRTPSTTELNHAKAFLEEQAAHLKSIHPPTDEKTKKDDKKKATKVAPEMQPLTSLCQTLLSANEFLYMD